MTVFNSGKPNKVPSAYGYTEVQISPDGKGKVKHSVKGQRKPLISVLRACLSILFCLAIACGLIVAYMLLRPCPGLKSDTTIPVSKADQCSIDENNRFDCWPEKNGATEESCAKRGCCWKPSSKPGTAPYCFFPSNYSGYSVYQIVQGSTGIQATLVRNTSTFFSKDVNPLVLKVDYQTDSRLRIKFFDPSNPRYEVPMDVPSGSTPVENPLYSVSVEKDPFNIIVKRKSTGATVFDTSKTAPLIFSDQYLQIGTQLSTNYLYGFGEHRNTFHQNTGTWRRLVFWNRDDVPKVDNNGYGSHPFFLNLEPASGKGGVANAHGVLLLNSNAGEVALQPSAVTYRMLGGVLDFYVLLGPEPISVVSQLTDVISRPYLPPFWAFGFHLCRWGYNNSSKLHSIIKRNRAAEMPYDIQWNDIDYMMSHRDWTFDPDRYKDLPSVVKDLHDNQQRYIIMADPAISSEQPAGSYPPFDDGKEMDVFIKTSDGQILIGEVWPGKTAFPDFFHPNAYSYWYKQAKEFHAKIKFDGIWIDMNEPSSFIDGSATGCTKSSLDNPPYLPPSIDGGKLMSRTICPSAKQAVSTHYNLHNMYGWSQANVTRATLDTLYPNKRSPIITRSSFVGSGRYTGHWLGDNDSSFDDLYYSIPGVLNFNLFGITFTGVDICGFRGTTTPELCTRWHQLGAFYTFMRNHADLTSPDQDPAAFGEPYLSAIRKALELRYQLLAVLYTGMFNAHTKGLPFLRPLFYNRYPNTELIDRQFMWGDQLLISPVLKEGDVTVTAYFPDDEWYDFYSGTPVEERGNVTLVAPLDTINVHIRGGSVLPLLPPTQRTDVARQQPFQLVVAIGNYGNASGELFWDDGESADSISSKKYTHVLFSFLGPKTGKQTFTSKPALTGYKPSNGMEVKEVRFLGVTDRPSSDVQINGKKAKANYSKSKQLLVVEGTDVDLLHPFTITWQAQP